MEKIQPVFKSRKGLVSASLFKREVEGKKGKFDSFSVALNISYVKPDGSFEQKTMTIIKRNIEAVVGVLNDVLENGKMEA